MKRAIVMCFLLVGFVGCGSAKQLSADLAEMPIQQEVLTNNHFKSDRTGNLTEAQLKAILESPAFLEEDTRLGIVPVTTAYQVDEEIPLNTVPARLSDALESTGFFEVSTEVSSDWPTDGNIAGLRELAARYRSKYLLLYRHRFVDRGRVNGWGWSWPTIVGIFMTPARTQEVAGVLEATMFDVRNGTILFTAFERVYDKEQQSIYHPEAKRRKMKERLLNEATDRLADTVKSKVRRLVAANPANKNSKVAKKEIKEENEKVATKPVESKEVPTNATPEIK